MKISLARIAGLTSFAFVLGFLMAALSPIASESGINFEFIAYLAGTLIALCALFFTIWQVRSIIQHNKLTNTPHLQLHNHILSKQQAVEVFITNDGLGPAIIRRSSFYFQDVEVPTSGSYKTYLLVEAMFNGQKFSPTYTHFDNGSMIPSGGRQLLFRVDFKDHLENEVDFIEIWNKASNKARIVVDYLSIYGDKKTLDDKIQD